MPESVAATLCLLGQKSVDEIAARLSPAKLEQVVGAYAAIESKVDLA